MFLRDGLSVTGRLSTIQPVIFQNYDVGDFYDELFLPDGAPRSHARLLVNAIGQLPAESVRSRQHAAEQLLLQLGITFNVYGDAVGTEKIFPFDIIPRAIADLEWRGIEYGLVQRIQALNLFLDDVYHEQRIVRDGIIPGDLVESASGFRPECRNLEPPRGLWCHICGSDLVRDKSGQFFVLEDNLRCPSGVSYMLANRIVMKRTFPRLFTSAQVRPIADYAADLRHLLEYLAPEGLPEPKAVVLTPGMYNSAYFEHSFLAQQMGIDLVEGRDLIVQEGYVWVRTTAGFERVDVIYRRIDDDFIDPTVFRPDSMLGVPGLMDVYREGRVALANAPGTGVADDKAVYAYVPDMIRYYLDQDAVIPNVPTYVCRRENECNHVLANIESLVVKAVNESGGYGMLIGPAASRTECDEFRRRIKANPRNYIAQPTLALSRTPILGEQFCEGRHVDLRPYILLGKTCTVTAGGLTRVALSKGSLVVNSSQGGGSKDTWIIPSEPRSA